MPFQPNQPAPFTKLKLLLQCVGAALLLLFTSVQGQAQSPDGIPYQAAARNAAGDVIPNQAISVRFSIRDGSAGGAIVYRETHQPTTNVLGLFNVTIGAGTPVSGTMGGINWGTGLKFMQVEMDPAGGTSYLDMGTTQMMSVPYALHAKTVEKSQGKTYLILSGAVTDAQAAQIIANDVGPNTQFVKIINTTNLTTVNLGSFSELVEVRISNNQALTSVSMSNLSAIFDYMEIQNNPALTSLDFPAFTSAIGNVYIYSNDALPAINFGNLTTVKQLQLTGAALTSIDLGGLTALSTGASIYIHAPALTTLNLNNLTSLNKSSVNIQNTALTSINLGSLISIGQFSGVSFFNNANVTSVNVSSLQIMTGYFEIGNSPLLTSLNFPALVSMGSNQSIYLRNNGFSSAVVNSLLAKSASLLPFINRQISLDGQTPPAPPSGQGITDKNTLISNGNTVFTD